MRKKPKFAVRRTWPLKPQSTGTASSRVSDIYMQRKKDMNNNKESSVVVDDFFLQVCGEPILLFVVGGIMNLKRLYAR